MGLAYGKPRVKRRRIRDSKLIMAIAISIKRIVKTFQNTLGLRRRPRRGSLSELKTERRLTGKAVPSPELGRWGKF